MPALSEASVIRTGDLVRVKIMTRTVRPYRSEARVVRIEDHVPVDGSRQPQVIARLSDGSWEFLWNLEKVR